MRRQLGGKASGIFLIIFGLIFGASGIVALRNIGIDSSWSRESGTIVEYVERVTSGRRRSTVYAAVVAYKVDGYTYMVTSKIAKSSPPTIGERREVAYDPANPYSAELVESVGSLWFLYVFPVVGVLSLFFGASLLLKSD